MRTVVFFLCLSLAACASPLGGGNQATPTAGAGTPGAGNVTPTASPVVLLGPRPCPTAVQSSAYWSGIVHAVAGVTSVARVQCGNLMGTPALQALVTVAHQGGHAVDVHVYTNITNPNPQQIFQLLNLYDGDAVISGYNTVLTAEVDQNSVLNRGRSPANYQRDLFREFKWSDAQQTLVQIVFPGLFPDLTRYQAEADQAAVNQGHDPWKLDALKVAQALAASSTLFNWGADAPAHLISGGGQHDLNAVVEVKSPHPGGGTIRVSMSRLESNTNGGIWEVTEVSSPTLSISTPAALARLHSPTTVTGKGNAFEGIIGSLRLLDHLYNQVGQAQVRGASGNGSTTFSTSLTYTTDFSAGAQEGLLMLFTPSQADGSIATGTLLKVLLT
ncbi:Gmad2 immunoglobulin-like domain-containing protein [Thermogemmatispora carboxidivorans]|uniref:Gmad2 immunoglobulin-like domain-containing protein n=1 Tax=Thermogemmatispora carboxidivorans TaxID=1382306 RepID=UPI00138E29B3|nr:Gmad2 immunoglobulin-like domain-containing protein [Thermogemmatispora carboxidivorans]